MESAAPRAGFSVIVGGCLRKGRGGRGNDPADVPGNDSGGDGRQQLDRDGPAGVPRVLGRRYARPDGPTILKGDVEIRGNLTVSGSITVSGRVTARATGTTAGLIRWGEDDSPQTLDQTIFLQKRCGSRDEQSALVQQPAGTSNGALWLQVPGARLPSGSIASQILQYGPLKAGNPRHQRFSPGTVFVQGDGSPFASVSTTLSGTGREGLAPMPLLFNHGSEVAARVDAGGFRGMTLAPTPAAGASR